jgi:hypothetical protein
VTHPHLLAAALLLSPFVCLYMMRELRPNFPAPAATVDPVGAPSPLAAVGSLPDEVSP